MGLLLRYVLPVLSLPLAVLLLLLLQVLSFVLPLLLLAVLVALYRRRTRLFIDCLGYCTLYFTGHPLSYPELRMAIDLREMGFKGLFVLLYRFLRALVLRSLEDFGLLFAIGWPQLCYGGILRLQDALRMYSVRKGSFCAGLGYAIVLEKLVFGISLLPDGCA